MNHTVLLLLIVLLCLMSTVAVCALFRQPEKSGHARSGQLDGLRGVLACLVVAHHAYYNFIWREGGSWGAAGNGLIMNLGAVSVSLFFLMSGFWHIQKVMQTPKMDWQAFYWGRIKRIYPVYAVVFLAVAAVTVWFRPLNANNIVDFLWFSVQWFLFQNAAFEGFQSHLVIAGVQWTLVYEFGMYAFLPLLHMIYHRQLSAQWVAWLAILLSWWIFSHSVLQMYSLFALALPAIFLAKPVRYLRCRWPWLVHILMLVLTVYVFAFAGAYSWQQKMALMVWFMFVAQGYSFGNLLNLYGLRKLGDMSYGVYLIHGLVLFMWFGVWRMFDFGRGDFVGYVLQLPLIYALVLVLSAWSLRYVELPLVRRH